MIAVWALLTVAVAMTLAQDVYPGAQIYHTGWYNALTVALVVVAAVMLRRRARASAVIAAFGAAAVVLTGIASGLMGPDTQRIVGVPGSSVHNDDAAGTFVFPLISHAPVVLQRGAAQLAIGTGRRYTAQFVIWLEPRDVVYVDVADEHGQHLTVTQPANAVFLSPVLLMQQTTTIAGMPVRYDSFSVPAANRLVKAVYFTPAQAAQLRTGVAAPGKGAVLFDVSDNADRAVPGGIGLAASGQRKAVGGLLIRPTVQSYPAVVLASAPYLPVFAAGIAAFVAGALASIRTP